MTPLICSQCHEETNSTLNGLCNECVEKIPIKLTCEACNLEINGLEGDKPHPRALLNKHVRQVHFDLHQRCSRRDESPIADSAFPGGDVWVNGFCSFCGSVSPERFFAAIERGDEIVPTDKNYKVYMRTSNPEEIKFYFQHLSVEQRKQFIGLLNGKKIKLGYPGHFYNLPFFCVREKS